MSTFIEREKIHKKFNDFAFIGINRIPQSQDEKLPEHSQAFEARSIVIHENFNPDSFDYDIALVCS